MPTAAPPEDANLLSLTADLALDMYGRNGGFQPFGTIETDAGLLISPAQSVVDQDGKLNFVNALRFLSIEHAGRRSAVAMETWTLFGNDPEDARLLDEIYARGGSMSEHPNAGEAIYVIEESDAGVCTRMHRIIREDARVRLEAGEGGFQPAGDRQSGGIFSAFHVPTGFQSHPAAQTFADGMRQLVTTNYSVIRPQDVPRSN